MMCHRPAFEGVKSFCGRMSCDEYQFGSKFEAAASSRIGREVLANTPDYLGRTTEPRCADSGTISTCLQETLLLFSFLIGKPGMDGRTHTRFSLMDPDLLKD
jgi:hypothetical protein